MLTKAGTATAFKEAMDEYNRACGYRESMQAKRIHIDRHVGRHRYDVPQRLSLLYDTMINSVYKLIHL